MLSNQKTFFDEGIDRRIFIRNEAVWERIKRFLKDAFLLFLVLVLMGWFGSEFVKGLDRGGPIPVRDSNGNCTKVLYPGDIEGPCRKIDILRKQKKEMLNNKKQ